MHTISPSQQSWHTVTSRRLSLSPLTGRKLTYRNQKETSPVLYTYEAATQGELRLGLPGCKTSSSAPHSLTSSISTRLCEDPVRKQRWVCRNGYSITANRVLTCVTSLYVSCRDHVSENGFNIQAGEMVQQLRDLSSVSSTHQVTHDCLQLQP